MKKDSKQTKESIKNIENTVYQSFVAGADFTTTRRLGFEDKRKWESMSKSQKRGILINTIILSILTIGAIFLCFNSDIFFNYFSKLFDKTDNTFLKVVYYSVPRLIITVCAVTCGFFGFTILKLINVSSKYRTQRSKTIGTLLFSAAKYVIVIALFFWILTNWGVDTTAILASAGILTLAIGLGAQTIIADLIAGVFIVVEGYIQVGDIITYNNFKGTIREIGLRVIVVENIYNDQLVVRNSDIKSVINNSKNRSNIILYFAVPNKVSSKVVDSLIKENIERYAKECSEDMNSLTYIGLCKIENYGSTYAVSFGCNENRSYQIERYLLNQIKTTLMDAGVYN